MEKSFGNVKSLNGPLGVEPGEEGAVLYRLDGRRRVYVHQVDCEPGSLSQRHVYVLDTGSVFYQWNGSACRLVHRGKALDLVKALIGERNGAAEHVMVNEEGPEVLSAFFAKLGWAGEGESPLPVPADVEVYSPHEWTPPRLFRVVVRVTPQKTSFALEEAPKANARALLDRGELADSAVVVVDTHSHVFLWIGRASDGLARDAGDAAAEMIFDGGAGTSPDGSGGGLDRPSWSCIFRVTQVGVALMMMMIMMMMMMMLLLVVVVVVVVVVVFDFIFYVFRGKRGKGVVLLLLPCFAMHGCP